MVYTKLMKRLSKNSGGIAMYVLLLVIIVGAFFMVGGTQKIFISPPTDLGNLEIDTSGTNNVAKDSLQLNTLKFKSCAGTAAVDFLIDTSGSMKTAGKIQSIKTALASFASNFTNKSVTGIRRFSSDNNNGSCPVHTATSRLTPIDFYSKNKSTFTSSASNLCADGATNTRTAFAAELTDLTQAVQNQDFKDNNFNLVFISDGIPESSGSSHGGACTGNESYQLCAPHQGNCRCFDDSQDPTTNPQIAQQVQALKSINGKNVRVFSVLVFDPVTDGPFEGKLTTMMTNIASSPTDFYKTTDPAAIKNIYNQISQKICKSTN